MKFIQLTKTVLLAAATSAAMIGCGPEDDGNATRVDNKIDSTESVKVTVGGKIFSVPSPIQTALLIKRTGANYDKAMLNPAKNSSNYATNFQKALSLGIYGADLGYVTIYDQTQDALSYFNAMNGLAQDLGVSSAFDKSLMERFKNNMAKKDSVLVLVSSAYRSADAFLKENDKNDMGALIIAGGWIEALHFATKVNDAKRNDEVTRRIAEQKSTIESLAGLMETYAGNQEYAELVTGLKELKTLFDDVKYIYIYEKPETDEAKKQTTITSKTEVKITVEQIDAISKKVESIRNLIAG